MPPTFPAPSTGALKVLRRLAFAGSAVTAIGGVCGVAAATYERHQRICLAEKILEQKRKIHACSRYRGSAETMAVMMEMAELGTFDGKDSLPRRKRNAGWGDEMEAKRENEVKVEKKLERDPADRKISESLGRLWAPKQLYDASRKASLDNAPANFGSRKPLFEYPEIDSKSTSAPATANSVAWEASLDTMLPEINSPNATFDSPPECFRPNIAPSPVVPLSETEPPTEPSHHVPPSLTRAFPTLDRERSIGVFVDTFHNFKRDFRHRISGILQLWVSQLASSNYGQKNHSILAKVPGPEGSVNTYMGQSDEDAIAKKFLQNDYSGALREFSTRGKTSDLQISARLKHGLFLAALLEMDHRTAGLIFEQSEARSIQHRRSFNELISALVIARDEEGMAKIFLRYCDRFRLVPTLSAQMVRALLNTKRFSEAEAFMEGVLRSNNHHLDRLKGISAAFISKLWVNSRNLDLVQSQFEKLVAWEDGALVCSKLYNSIIQACVESNEDSKARGYYEDMKSKHGLARDIRTGLLLLEIESSKGNWQAVEEGLHELYAEGVTSADRPTFTKGLTRLMGTYQLDRSAVEVQKFLYDAIDLFELVPDQFMTNEYVAMCVREGRFDLVADWFSLVSEKKWNLVFNGKTFAMAFSAYWLSTRVGYEHLCVLLQTCVNLLGGEGLDHRGHRLLSHDVIDTVRQAVMYRHRGSHAPAITRRIWNKLGVIEMTCTDSNAMLWKAWRRDPEQLRKKMLYERSRGNDRQAVEYYKEARAAGGLIKRTHLQMAVQASIRSTGSTDEASRLFGEVASVEESAIVSGEIFYHNLESWQPEQGYEQLRKAVEEHYATLEKQRLPVDFRIVVAATCRLMELGFHHLAIEMLMWMHESRWCKRTPFDMSCMTTLLRAYYMNKNNQGAEWVITQVLHRKMPIDHEFYYQVWLARRQLVWKRMTEGQICGTEDIPEDLRKWSLAMDIWVRDVKMREKQVTYERHTRGYDLIKLARDLGGLGPEALKGKEAERLLTQATGELEPRIMAYQQETQDIETEKIILAEESWMRRAGWVPCRVKIHYVPRPRAPRIPHVNIQGFRARRRALFALRALDGGRAIRKEVKRPELNIVKAQWKAGKPFVVLSYTSRVIRHIL